MYKTPYIKPERTVQETIKNINKEIEEEKRNPEADKHRILKLEEQKLIAGLFQNDFGIYSKYKNPW